jgi:hypothetical protein
MKVVGFSFKKISGERLKDSVEELKVDTGISLSEIKSVSSSVLKTKEEILEVGFDYSVSYDPDFAKINFSGTLLVTLDSKEAREVIKQWKDKKLPDEFKVFVFNMILKKSSIKAIQMEEELHLPLHINMPKIAPTEKKE